MTFCSISKIILGGLILCVGLGLFFSPTKTDAFPEKGSVMVAMRDGEKLSVDVLLPAEKGKFPCILIMTPYNKKHFTSAMPVGKRRGKMELFARDRYVYVLVDWRGYFASKGARKPRIKAMEQNGRDGFDMVEWIAKQDWSNGKVGMWGPSALGKIQYATAVERPPHLVCISPIVTGHEQSYNHYYRGGVMRKGLLSTMNKIGYAGVESVIKKMPKYNRMWKAIERSTDYSKINVPVLLIGGWFDIDTPDVLRTYELLGKGAGQNCQDNLKILIGPWTHMGATAGNTLVGEIEYSDVEAKSFNAAKEFFDYYLCEKTENGYKDQPNFRYYQMNSNKWSSTKQWPPVEVKETEYFLRQDAVLSVKPSLEKKLSLSFRFDPDNPSPATGGFNLPTISGLTDGKYVVRAGSYDQSEVEKRKDCLVFTSEELPDDLVFQGVAKMKVFLSSDRKDTDIAVRLCDVGADGKAMLVSDGIQRMRYRDGLEKTKWMEKGEIYMATVSLVPSAWTFKKGHRIKIIVSSSIYPSYDVNPNTGDHFIEDADKALVAENSVHFDETHPSSITLSINPTFK